MKEVLGDSVPEKMLVEAVLSKNFDIQKALDSILAQDNKQNGKTKNEDNVIVGKPTKGTFIFIFAELTKFLKGHFLCVGVSLHSLHEQVHAVVLATFSEALCYYLLHSAKKECLAQGHLIGFVPEAGLELSIS